MIAPVSRLRKKDIVWLSRHTCKHRHTYLEHYNCYLKENPQGIKQGFFDIKKFDRIVTHYGKRFDVPFLRSCALYWGLEKDGLVKDKAL